MQFKNYMEKLLGNKAKIAMLRAFCAVPEKVWTSRDLAKFIGTYNSTILRNLGDFEDMGIVEIGMHGHVKTIKLNRAGFSFSKIAKPIFDAEKNTLNSLIEDLKEIIKPGDVKFFALFGSVAEGKERPNSDIDLLIVSEKKEKVVEALEKNRSEIAKKYGNEISFQIFSQKEFKLKQSSPFLRDAKKKYISIYGDWP